MSHHDDERFRVRPGAPKQRGDAYLTRVLREVNKAGIPLGKAGRRPGSRLGRGHVAARFAGRRLGANARRVTIKLRLVHLAKAGPRSTAMHLRYLEREGVDRQGGAGHAYGPESETADLGAFKAQSADDRHQFRFIVSPEDADALDDLRTYTRQFMARMEADLGTRLTWVAVEHWNTDNPHTHVVLRGKDDTGKDLILSRDYIADGMRQRAAELATAWLGPRTEREIQQSRQREVTQERWTGVDRTLQREADNEGHVAIARFAEPRLQPQRSVLIGRLQHLQRLGLATEHEPGRWALHADAEPTLRAMGERGDIVRTMQRALHGVPRECAVFSPAEAVQPIVGRVIDKGLAGELHDQGYLIVDGTDGKVYYVGLPPRAELEAYPMGAVVDVHGAVGVRAADRTIAMLAIGGMYRTAHHRTVMQGQATRDRDPKDVIDAHVRRLEALRRAGIVVREADGVWRVPDDLIERGQQYDAQRRGGVAITLRSPLPLERQIHALGETWLDQQAIAGGRGLSSVGFGAAVKEALQQRADVLIEQGLAQRRGARVVFARHLLTTLREREVAQAAKDLAADTGLAHRPVVEGQRVAGVYRRNLLLVSGRYAMLDDGLGFSLVPWKPVIESRLGQTLSAVVRDGRVTWAWGRQRGPSVS